MAPGSKKKTGSGWLPVRENFFLLREGSELHQILSRGDLAGFQQIQLPSGLAVAEHEGCFQGTVMGLHHLGIKGQQLLATLYRVTGLDKQLETLSLQAVGVSAHVDEKFDSFLRLQPQGVLQGEIHLGIGGGTIQDQWGE